MEVNYTYEELKRERMTVLIENLIREMAKQDNLGFFKYIKTQKLCSSEESTEILMDVLYGLDDENYKKFIDKLTDVIIDM